MLYERALTIFERTLDPQNLGTANCLNGLARLLHHQGDLVGAQSFCERALGIHEKLLGPSHRVTAQSLSILADLLRDRGDFSGSRRCYERALTTFERISPEHPETNRVRCNFARLLVSAGSAAEALALGETALASHEKSFGKKHRWTRDSARSTADCLAALGRAEDARVLRNSYGCEPDAPRTPQ